MSFSPFDPTTPDPQRVELLRDEFERLYAKRWCETAERVSTLRNGDAYVGLCLTSAWEGYQMAALSAADAIQPPQRDEVRIVLEQIAGAAEEAYNVPDNRRIALGLIARAARAALATTTDAAGGGA